MRSINLNPFGGHSGAALEFFYLRAFYTQRLAFMGLKLGFWFRPSRQEVKKKIVINIIEMPHSFWLFLKGLMRRQSNGFIEKRRGWSPGLWWSWVIWSQSELHRHPSIVGEPFWKAVTGDPLLPAEELLASRSPLDQACFCSTCHCALASRKKGAFSGSF